MEKSLKRAQHNTYNGRKYFIKSDARPAFLRKTGGMDMILNREKGAPPLYSQVETILRTDIEHGKYNKGDSFPTENMLMEEYQVSRVTIRQAMTALSQAGYIMSRRGIGTEVTYEKIDEHMKSVISFTDEMKQHNITMNTSYCKMEKITPSTRVAMALEIPKTDFCYRLTRVRNVQGSPLVYTITYLKCVVELPLDEKYYMKSLYKFLKDTYQIVIEKGKDTLEAALPSEEVQAFLEIGPAMPVFKRVRKTYLPENEVFEYSICYYPGNRYKYTVDL